MQIQMKDGLPIVSLNVSYEGKTICLENVLFDTGCAATVFDTDLMASIDLHIDFINGTAKRMYGIGGTSEACYEQLIPNLIIDGLHFETFRMQLGSIQEPYGFEGILGIDYMQRTGLKVDFEKMNIRYR
ncbi:aspartyl protease family protein [Paenibacillus sp. YYML68]|uniref:aspartyl protease family protein n=1 Tax=Paenibacillus sp. YYML68 TaxID=2909250 RepID=UPI00248F7715|nr:aspartyl protease family protein [Paenibacillus sp. YYML68]